MAVMARAVAVIARLVAGDSEGGMRVGEGGARDGEERESGEAARALPGASMRHEHVEEL